ncbi:MAG: DUF3795 domain-containing protein [Deltaproteobacteria bacterium]|nr:DUF3795 domain-containing protein [Deltaproteobacteria bacterium]MBW2087082.1 DUF3795 domain-containing protein [Deltaproteobacteria bacterium]
MEKMIAFCGLICTECPAFIATQKDDDEGKAKLAASWSTEEQVIKPEDINCDGCLSAGERVIKFCNACEVRRCGFEKNVENCAFCGEYACERLNRIYEFIQTPVAKATLEEIRKSL